MRLTGELDVAALEAALNDVVERHESLRTVFPDRLGVPRQEILSGPSARLRLEVVGVSEASLGGAVSAALRRGFDLSVEPPLRAHLYALGEAEHVLVLLLHHIAGDGWSLSPLWRDVAGFYAARRRGVAAAVAPLGVQYADYTLWQRAVLGEESDPDSALSRQLAYWTDRLQDLPDQLDLPSDRARPAVASHRGASIAVALPAELHRGLLQQDGQASLFMCCRRGLQLLSRLGRAAILRSAHRLRGAPRARGWLGSSSTRWCCAPTLGSRASALCWLGCGPATLRRIATRRSR